MKRGNLTFGGGVPTAPDVRALSEAFPQLAEGQVVSFEDVEKVIGVAKESHRFKTVTWQWRRKLERDANIILASERGRGFVVADPCARADLAAGTMKGGLRRVKRAGALALATPREALGETEARAVDHVVRLSAMLTTLAATEAKKLKYPVPVKQLK